MASRRLALLRSDFMFVLKMFGENVFVCNNIIYGRKQGFGFLFVIIFCGIIQSLVNVIPEFPY